MNCKTICNIVKSGRYLKRSHLNQPSDYPVGYVFVIEFECESHTEVSDKGGRSFWIGHSERRCFDFD